MAGESQKNGAVPQGDATRAAGEGPPPGRNLFAYAGFNKLFLGSLSGKLADRVYQMALVAAGIVIFAEASSENVLAEIQIWATVPLLLAYPLLGTLIDSVDRRKLMYALMAAKGLVVFLLLWFLWPVREAASATQLSAVASVWWCGLALVFVLNLLDAPFGPARAAAVPDVAPLEQRGLAASLMATSGLIAILLGTLLGGLLAETRHLGPANTILVAVALYAAATVLLMVLPNAVAVPGRARASAATEAGETDPLTVKGYFIGLAEGLKYAARTRGILDLSIFETAFWCVSSIFYLIFAWQLRFQMQLRPNDITDALSLGLGCVGVGLFLGAVLAGHTSRRLSPIVTYTSAFILMGLGGIVILSATAHRQQIPGTDARLVRWDRVLVAAPATAGVRQGTVAAQADYAGKSVLVSFSPTATEAVPRVYLTVVRSAFPYGVLLYMFVVGFGGGLLLGRVDADVLALADERMRGRVFSLKATLFTVALLAAMGPLSLTGDGVKAALAAWFGVGLLAAALPALAMSWRVDLALWAQKRDLEPAGPLQRFCYALVRDTFRLILRVYFRYEVIGAEKIPREGPVILVANHASFADPLFLGCGTRRIVQYIIYSLYYRSFAHPLFRLARTIPVDDASAVGALKAGVRALANGGCVGLYPEGRVSDDGRLQPGHPGALFLAQHSGAPIYPVAIKGNSRAFPRRAWFPRPRKVTMIVGAPFTVNKEASRQEITDRTAQLMRDFAAMLETEPPRSS